MDPIAVHVEQIYDEGQNRFSHFQVFGDVTKKRLLAIEGVSKVKEKGREEWHVWKVLRFYPGEVEQNIYESFNGAGHGE